MFRSNVQFVFVARPIYRQQSIYIQVFQVQCEQRLHLSQSCFYVLIPLILDEELNLCHLK